MKKLVVFSLAAALLAPAIGQAATSDQTTSVRVAYNDLDVNTARGAHLLLARLESAALETCGASSFSFREYQDAVRRSACYRSSLGNAVTGLNMPLVSTSYEAHAPLTVASN